MPLEDVPAVRTGVVREMAGVTNVRLLAREVVPLRAVNARL